MERAAERGRERRKAETLPQIGIDEKAFWKGHGYVTLVNDGVRGRVLYMAEGREQSSLDGSNSSEWMYTGPYQEASKWKLPLGQEEGS